MVVFERLRQLIQSPAILMEVAMQHDITKLCADSLRQTTLEKYSIKLKPSHAHELVARFFGYSSKNAMLADNIAPISNLNKAKNIVTIDDALIDQRRQCLQGLPADLPDSYTLGEAVYTPLFSDEFWASDYPPFRSVKALAKHLVESSDSYQAVFGVFNIPYEHIVDAKTTDNELTLKVSHCYKVSEQEMSVNGVTTIRLPRVAGHIGYGEPDISVVRLSGQASGTIKLKGAA